MIVYSCQKNQSTFVDFIASLTKVFHIASQGHVDAFLGVDVEAILIDILGLTQSNEND